MNKGFKQSGYGRDGGKEGLYEYVKPAWQETVKILDLTTDLKKFGAAYLADGPGLNNGKKRIQCIFYPYY